MSAIDQTLDAVKKAQASPLPESVTKAWTQSGSPTAGLTQYDLQAPALTMYPVLTPLRNRVPRVPAAGGTQANWKAITGINTSGIALGVSGGNRGGVIATSTADYFAAYRGLGLEDYVHFEADYAAQGFDDVKARAVQGLLRSFMIGEENTILGGNTSVALGTTPTPTAVGSATGGTFGPQTLSVICVALGYDAFWAVAGANNGNTGQQLVLPSAVVPATITRTNIDGSVDTFGGGSARKSAAGTATIPAGATGSATASVVAVQGAFGYAWYWGAAGAEVLGAITTINSVLITAAATGTQTAASLPATDNSTNGLVYDGFLAQVLKPGSGGYVKVMPTGAAGVGTPLTATTDGGIAEIDAAFAYFWNLYRLSPDEIYVNAQELLNINRKVIASGGAPLIRLNIDAASPANIQAGVVIGTILNKIVNKQVKVTVHPTMPPGTIFFWSDGVPYTLSGVQNVTQMKLRREYYQIEWPLTRRRYEYGVYADGVLQNYFPPAFGVITNIPNG